MTLWDKAEVVLVLGPNYLLVILDVYIPNKKNTTFTQFSKKYNKLIIIEKLSMRNYLKYLSVRLT